VLIACGSARRWLGQTRPWAQLAFGPLGPLLQRYQQGCLTLGGTVTLRELLLAGAKFQRNGWIRISSPVPLPSPLACGPKPSPAPPLPAALTCAVNGFDLRFRTLLDRQI